MELQTATGAVSPVDQWIALLGLRRDRDLAIVAGRTRAPRSRVSTWRRYGIPADVVIDLYLYAHEHGLEPPLEMLKSRSRRKTPSVAASPSSVAA